MYPQVIKHEAYEGQPFNHTQIVWLKIDCPYDGSLSTLCKSFFKAIDDLLGTRYLEKYGYMNRITSTMLLHMTSLASMYGIGDRKSTRLNSSHVAISYAVFCLKIKKSQ